MAKNRSSESIVEYANGFKIYVGEKGLILGKINKKEGTSMLPGGLKNPKGSLIENYYSRNSIYVRWYFNRVRLRDIGDISGLDIRDNVVSKYGKLLSERINGIEPIKPKQKESPREHTEGSILFKIDDFTTDKSKWDDLYDRQYDALVKLRDAAQYLIDNEQIFDIEKHGYSIKKSENRIKVADDPKDDDESGEDIDPIPEEIEGSFFSYLKEEGLEYPQFIIEDFLLSLKSKNFMILAGGTGCGKTQLAMKYGEFLKKNGRGDLSLVPVEPNWTERRFVLGYYNTLDKRYVKGKALEAILKSKEGPHILIFDEMNMARVEKYLADYLSSLESKAPLWMYDEKLEHDSDVDPSIDISDDLFTIGTVNIDETTTMFSPKVLDRANVIELDSDRLLRTLCGESKDFWESAENGNIEFLDDCTAKSDLSPEEILSHIKERSPESYDRINSDLGEIYKILNEVNLQFGFRTFKEILNFIYNSMIYESGSSWRLERYLDSMIMERILPKIRGGYELAQPLEKLELLCSGHGYRRSLKKIERMIGVLNNRNYTAFFG